MHGKGTIVVDATKVGWSVAQGDVVAIGSMVPILARSHYNLRDWLSVAYVAETQKPHIPYLKSCIAFGVSIANVICILWDPPGALLQAA
jgi:hypothetical protein